MDQPGHAAAALAAARELRTRLASLRADAGLEAAIGVSSGEAVAATSEPSPASSTPSRFEYTVIGDPVNEAARLTELAKLEPDRLLASAAAVRGAGPAKERQWAPGGEVVLRGRQRPTELARPVEHAAAR